MPTAYLNNVARHREALNLPDEAKSKFAAIRFFMDMFVAVDHEGRAQHNAVSALISSAALISPPSWLVKELWICLRENSVVGRLAAEMLSVVSEGRVEACVGTRAYAISEHDEVSLHVGYYHALCGNREQLARFSSDIDSFLKSGESAPALRCALIACTHFRLPQTLEQFRSIAASKFASKVLAYPTDLDMRIRFLDCEQSDALVEVCNTYFRFTDPISGVVFYAPSSSFLSEFRLDSGWHMIERLQRASFEQFVALTPATELHSAATRLATCFAIHPATATLEEIMLEWLRGNRGYWAPFSIRP